MIRIAHLEPLALGDLKIAHNVQFLLLPQCFPLLVIGYPFNYKDFLFFDKTCSKSSAAELLFEGKGEGKFRIKTYSIGFVIVQRHEESCGFGEL